MQTCGRRSFLSGAAAAGAAPFLFVGCRAGYSANGKVSAAVCDLDVNLGEFGLDCERVCAI